MAIPLIRFLVEEPMPYEQARSLCSAPARRWNDIPEIKTIPVNVDLAQLERLRTFARTGEIVPVLEEQEMCVNCGEREATHDVIDRDDTVGYVERLALCDVCDFQGDD